MTEKRFTLTYEKIGKYFDMGIVDHETKEPFDDTTYEFHQCSFQDSKDEMEDLCLLLNALHKENEQLKQDNTNLHRAMSRDRVKYNQFKDKVFCCLNNRLKLFKDCCMSNEAKIIEDLTKELEE